MKPVARAHAFTLKQLHSCRHTHARGTRATAQGQTEMLRASPPPPVDKATNMRHRPLLRLSSPPSQPQELVRSAGSRVPADSTQGLRSAGAPQLPHTPKVTGPTMSHTQRPADPCTYPHLGGSVGRAADRLVSGGRRTGSGAGSGWGPLQRPRRGGSVRLSVRGSHRTEAAAAGASASSYARACGGRRLWPIRSGPEQTDS